MKANTPPPATSSSDQAPANAAEPGPRSNLTDTKTYTQPPVSHSQPSHHQSHIPILPTARLQNSHQRMPVPICRCVVDGKPEQVKRGRRQQIARSQVKGAEANRPLGTQEDSVRQRRPFRPPHRLPFPATRVLRVLNRVTPQDLQV